MPTTPYATSEQLGSYIDGTVPADAARLLTRATELIDDHIITAIYAVDAQGYPVDQPIKDALADAVCAQVEYWLADDEEEDILGPTQGLAIGGTQVQYGAGTNRATPMYLAPRAARHLRAAGLLNASVGS